MRRRPAASLLATLIVLALVAPASAAEPSATLTPEPTPSTQPTPSVEPSTEPTVEHPDWPSHLATHIDGPGYGDGDLLRSTCTC